MKTTPVRTPVLLSLFFTLVCSGAIASVNPNAPVNNVPVNDAPGTDAPIMNALGTDLFFQSGSTGMVLLVVHSDQVSFRAYGQTAPNSHQLPTEHSLLRLDSLTKVFTADLLNKLVLARTVRLADPLQRYAPAGIVVPARAHPITLLDLATHTSGLPREIGNAPPGPQFTYPDYRTRWTWLQGQHLHSIPGTAALYSNVAFDFLADALQSATHKPYPRLLAERTLNPLQMHSTTFYPDAEQCRRLLASAFDDGPCTATEATDGSSGLYSTAADMALWLKYLLRTGAPAQDPGAQAVYLQPSSLVRQQGLDHAGEPTGIGLAWIHILPLDTPSHIVEKTGGGAGFQTYIAIDHARQTAVFLAATYGPLDSHVNRFKAANGLLLAVSGLPPMPPSAYKKPGHRR